MNTKPLIAVDFETTDLSGETILGVSVYNETIQWSRPWNYDTDKALRELVTTHTIVVHNALFDVYTVLWQLGYRDVDFHDTRIIVYNLYPNQEKYSLQACCELFNVPGKFDKPETWALWNSYMAEYCQQDSKSTYELCDKALPLLMADTKAYNLYLSTEIPYLRVIHEMGRGVPLDRTAVVVNRSNLLVELDKAHKDCTDVAGLQPGRERLYSRQVQFDGAMAKSNGKWVFIDDNVYVGCIANKDKSSKFKLNYDHCLYSSRKEQRYKKVTLFSCPEIRYPMVGYLRKANTIIYDHCELQEFNPGSSQQIANLLIKLGWKPTEKTESGQWKCDREIIKKVAEKHDFPIIEKLLLYTKLKKLYSTYLGRFEENLKAIDLPNGGTCVGLKSNFNPTGTRTGRLSSTNPNVANVPSKGEWGSAIRKCFVAPPGYKLVSADLSNFEARALAFYCERVCKDSSLATIFRNGLNFHTENTINWGLMDVLGVSKEQQQEWIQLHQNGEDISEIPEFSAVRFFAKTILFGIIYGQGATGVGKGDKDLGEKLMASVNSNCPSIQNLKQLVYSRAEQTKGIIYTWFGRRLYYPEFDKKYALKQSAKIKHGNLWNLAPDELASKSIESIARSLRSRAERQIFNALFQGTNADLIKIISLKLLPTALDIGAWQVLSVYDELTYCVPDNHTDDFAALMTSAFTSEGYLPGFPIVGSAKIGQSWYDVH